MSFTGQFNGVFHPFRSQRLSYDVFFILVRRQYLFQYGTQLNFSQYAPRLNVGKNLFQIAHTGSQILHLSQALVYLLKTFADHAERLTYTILQRLLQLLVDSKAHPFQLPVVVLGQLPNLL